MPIYRKNKDHEGLTLIEVIIAIGIMAVALLAILSVASMALTYQRQSINNLNAASAAETVLNKAITRVLSEDPPATIQAQFWGTEYPFPSTPYDSGTLKIGREEYQYRIYALNVPGIGDPAAAPVPNVLKKVDAYVWWKDSGAGEKRSFATRLVNQGERL